MLLAALPAAFFIACGRPNQERSSLPVLTVLPLLAGEHLEEGDGVEKTRVQDLWEWETPRGLFLSSQKVPADVLVEVLVEMLVDFVPNSPRKSYPDLESANTLSVSSRFKGLLRTRYQAFGKNSGIVIWPCSSSQWMESSVVRIDVIACEILNAVNLRCRFLNLNDQFTIILTDVLLIFFVRTKLSLQFHCLDFELLI